MDSTATLHFPRAESFAQKMKLRYPIVQAAMGGSELTKLAVAVSEGGGMGGLGVTWADEDGVRAQVEKVRRETQKPFAVGYVLSFPPNTLHAALEEGAPIVHFSWGTPPADLVKLVRSSGASFGMQVSNLIGVHQAVDAGADYISIQGQEAGGHVQAATSWKENLPALVEAAGDTPVLVAGGLGNGRALRLALQAGASGGVFGTRFVATQETPYHRQYEERLVQSTASDSILTVCFDGGWPNALHRVLQNNTTRQWEAAGSQPSGSRPGENDVVAVIGNDTLPRYTIFPPEEGMPETAPSDMAMYAGIGLDVIHDVPGATELVGRLWSECIEKYN